jgi:hypothetical protein
VEFQQPPSASSSATSAATVRKVSVDDIGAFGFGSGDIFADSFEAVSAE